MTASYIQEIIKIATLYFLLAHELEVTIQIVQRLSNKFCENCSLCNKSAKLCITKDYSVISDFKMGTT